MTEIQQLEEILDKYVGLLTGNWQPRPGEEGMVYPTRLRAEALSDLQAMLNNARVDELERCEKQKIYQGIGSNPRYAISTDYVEDRIAELQSPAKSKEKEES